MLTDSQKYKVEFFKSKFKQNLGCNEEESKVVDGMFQTLINLYLYFKEEVLYVSVKDDNYPYYMITPSNGEYELLDYLLNRMVQNVEKVSIGEEDYYLYLSKEIQIHINKNDKFLEEFSPTERQLFQNVTIAHETIHALTIAPYLLIDKKYVGGNEYPEDVVKRYNLKREIYQSTNTNNISKNDIENLRNLNSQIPVGLEIEESFVEALATILSHLTEYIEMKAQEDNDDDLRFFTAYSFNNNDSDLWIYTPNKNTTYQFASNYMYLFMQLLSKKSQFETMFLGKDTMIKEINNLSDNNHLFDYLKSKIKNIIHWSFYEKHENIVRYRKDLIELTKVIINIYDSMGKIGELKSEYLVRCDETYQMADDYRLKNRKK